MNQENLAVKLRKRHKVTGFRISMPCAPLAERLARLGFGCLLVDLQHGLLDYTDCTSILTAITAGGGQALVRVASHDPAMIGKVLDAGADGVIVPAINNAAEAAAVVRACRYPMAGDRSWGPTRAESLNGRGADFEPAVVVMLETPHGLERSEEICAVSGVDAVYVGSIDLALTLGEKPGSKSDVVIKAVRRMAAAASQAGIGCGIQALGAEASTRRFAEGFTFVVCGTDVKTLEGAASQILRQIDN